MKKAANALESRRFPGSSASNTNVWLACLVSQSSKRQAHRGTDRESFGTTATTVWRPQNTSSASLVRVHRSSFATDSVIGKRKKKRVARRRCIMPVRFRKAAPALRGFGRRADNALSYTKLIITDCKGATESVERSHRVTHVQWRQLHMGRDVHLKYRPQWDMNAWGDHQHRFWIGPVRD